MTTHLYRPIHERMRNPRTAEMFSRYLYHSNGVDTFKLPRRAIMRLAIRQAWGHPDACGPIGAYLLPLRPTKDSPVQWMEATINVHGQMMGYSQSHRAGVRMHIDDQLPSTQSFIRNNIISKL